MKPLTEGLEPRFQGFKVSGFQGKTGFTLKPCNLETLNLISEL